MHLHILHELLNNRSLSLTKEYVTQKATWIRSYILKTKIHKKAKTGKIKALKKYYHYETISQILKLATFITSWFTFHNLPTKYGFSPKKHVVQAEKFLQKHQRGHKKYTGPKKVDGLKLPFKNPSTKPQPTQPNQFHDSFKISSSD